MKKDVKVKVKQYGFKSEEYLENLSTLFDRKTFTNLAEESLQDFVKASPTLEIAAKWFYEIDYSGHNVTLRFMNDTIKDGVNIAIIMDIGHATYSGQWVPGENYLKEPIKKVYKRINELLTEAHNER